MARHSVSVAAVVTNEAGQVLVIQRRDNGAWQIPGGVLELDESITAGVQREVTEETGLTIKPGQLTGIYKNVRAGVVALVFRAQVISGEPRPTAESAAVEWWPVDRITAEMDVTFAVRVHDALNGGQVAVRIHDGTRILTDR